MISEDKNMDKVFRDKLENFEVKPPASAWNAIQDSLIADKRKKRMLFWQLGGVAAVILIAFIAGWQLQQFSNNSTKELVFSEQKEDNIIEERANEIKPEQATTLIADNKTENKETVDRIEKTIVNNFPVIKNDISAEKIEPSRPVRETFELLSSLNFLFNNGQAEEKQLKFKKEKEVIVFTADEIRIIENNRAQLALNKDLEDNSNWMLGVAVAPNFSVGNNSYDAKYESNMANAKSLNNLNLGGGLTIEYKTKKRWSVQSGLYYSKLNQTSGNNVSTDRIYSVGMLSTPSTDFVANAEVSNGSVMMNSVSGVISIDDLPDDVILESSLDKESVGKSALISSADFSQNFEYIEIPLYFKYLLVDSKLDMQIISGVSTNILVGNNVYLQSGNQSDRIGETLGMSAVNYSGILGFGLDYELTSNIKLSIEPRIKYFLNSLSVNEDVDFQPYSFGVYTGLSYSF